MKRWCETLAFRQPLREVDVRGLAALPAGWPERIAQREQAVFEEGRLAGEKALSEQLIRQRAELLEIQNGLLESLRQALPQVMRDTESALVRLALEVARKVVGGMPITAELVEGVVRESLRHVETTSRMVVLLHPDDLELLQRANAPILLPSSPHDSIRFHASPEVTRGGCVVQTQFGVLDAQRETQFALLDQEMQR